ncbi:LCP family glycopolymer transferase [Paenibacillus glycanilyticus]|uniref:LCP family protein n=1 Tax=Paenibacillus glycanilyticus TaxID=126569 RepID=UPI003EBAAE41
MTQGSAELPSRRANAKTAPRSPKQPKKRRVWKVVLLLFLAVILIIVAYFGFLANKANNAIQQIGTVSNDDVKIPTAESVKKKAVGMVLLGLDTRAKGGGMNTDVMMVAVFNPNSKSATVISIPRDSLLQLEGYGERKANANYATFFSQARSEKGMDKEAAEEDAKRAIRDMLGKFFGVDLKYTAVVNFKGFEDVVDALGGIEVNVDMDMRYVDNYDGTNINLKKGFQKLNGDQALDFVRYRKSNDGKNMSSDFDRNKRESEVVAKIVDKMKSLSGITKMGEVIDAVGDNMEIDMPPKEIQNLMKTYFGISSSNVQFIPLEGVWKSPYVYLDEAKLSEARAALQAKMAE